MKSAERQLLAREIHVLLAILNKRTHHAMEERLAACNYPINGLQLGVLRVLGHGPHTISELSRTFHLDPSTLVPVVDALEGYGYVQRGRDPNDRRRTPLNLTDAGRQMIESIPPLNEDDLLMQSLSGLGDERMQQLLSLLRDWLRAMPDGEQILDDVRVRIHAHNQHRPDQATIHRGSPYNPMAGQPQNATTDAAADSELPV